MAKYRVLVDSFIDNTLRLAGTIVDINDDPATGGMTPSTNLAACDDAGDLVAVEGAAPRKRKPKAEVVDATGGEADLA